MQTLVQRENASVDTTLPDPRELSYTVDEWEFYYNLWTIWAATGKRFLPSQLITELQSHGRVWHGIMDMESFAGKLREQWKLDHADTKP